MPEEIFLIEHDPHSMGRGFLSFVIVIDPSRDRLFACYYYCSVRRAAKISVNHSAKTVRDKKILKTDLNSDKSDACPDYKMNKVICSHVQPGAPALQYQF